VSYTGEGVAVPVGGIDRGVAYLDNLDVTLGVRLGDLIGWDGLSAFAYGLGNQGKAPSSLVGDLQATSNIEAPMAWRLYEVWLQQSVADGQASVLAGLYDLNSEFDVNRTGALFLHSSHGIGAAFGLSGRTGPSIFPATALGIRVRTRFGNGAYAQAALLDGVPDRPSNRQGPRIRLREGALSVVELGLGTRGTAPVADRTPGSRAREVGGRGAKLAVGGWVYSTQIRDWTTVNTPGPVERARGSYGLYALVEGPLYSGLADATQGLAAFLRLGLADDRFNRIARYVGAGVVYTGLTPKRPADQVGLAVAVAVNGGAYQAAQARAAVPTTDAEIAIEGTYRMVVTEWLSVQGDVQCVVHPNTDPSIDTAFVPGLRVVAQH